LPFILVMFDRTRTAFVALALAAALAAVPLGCKAPQAAAEAPTAEVEVDKDGGATHAAAGHGDEGHGHAQHAKKYTVPFAAESDKDDPLALTRSYFQNVIGDNAAYMRTHDERFFKSFAASQKPRATIVACSDSRVQSPAFDATPENDDFTNGEGSVEYGVHHLKTPVLFILGHTGCGAVKAAMGDYAKESEPIRHELDALKIAKRKEGVKDDDSAAWLEGVVDNVHDQVAAALVKFDEEVAAGTLTIVGGVYDFRNDMKQGAGKVVLVNVNGHKDAAKVASFERGVLGLVGPDPHGADGGAGLASAGGHGKDAIEIKDLKDLRDALKDGKDTKDAKDAKEPKDVKEPKPKEAHASAH
jgi:carbonic anhydrase